MEPYPTLTFFQFLCPLVQGVAETADANAWASREDNENLFSLRYVVCFFQAKRRAQVRIGEADQH